MQAPNCSWETCITCFLVVNLSFLHRLVDKVGTSSQSLRELISIELWAASVLPASGKGGEEEPGNVKHCCITSALQCHTCHVPLKDCVEFGFRRQIEIRGMVLFPQCSTRARIVFRNMLCELWHPSSNRNAASVDSRDLLTALRDRCFCSRHVGTCIKLFVVLVGRT